MKSIPGDLWFDTHCSTLTFYVTIECEGSSYVQIGDGQLCHVYTFGSDILIWSENESEIERLYR